MSAGSERVRKLGPCVVLEGGPRNAWWYTQADWDAMRANKAHTSPDLQRYESAGRQLLHPNQASYPGLAGAVWRWTG